MDIGDSMEFTISIIPAFVGTYVAAAGVTLQGRTTALAATFSKVLVKRTGALTYDCRGL